MGAAVAVCPRCGGANAAGSTFCAECGRRLAGDTVPFDPVPSEGGDTGAEDGSPAVRGRVLVVQNGPLRGSRLQVTRSEATIGRDPDSDVFLDDVTVSRHHATLRAGRRSDTIADSGSLNGTYVNGARVESSSLASGDVVQIGRYRLRYLRSPEPARATPRAGPGGRTTDQAEA